MSDSRYCSPGASLDLPSDSARLNSRRAANTVQLPLVCQSPRGEGGGEGGGGGVENGGSMVVMKEGYLMKKSGGGQGEHFLPCFCVALFSQPCAKCDASTCVRCSRQQDAQPREGACTHWTSVKVQLPFQITFPFPEMLKDSCRCVSDLWWVCAEIGSGAPALERQYFLQFTEPKIILCHFRGTSLLTLVLLLTHRLRASGIVVGLYWVNVI